MRVIGDKPSNSLIVMSSGRDFLALRGVIRELDLPRRQVYIEAMILEVGVGDGRQSARARTACSPVGDGVAVGGVQTSSLSSLDPRTLASASGLLGGLLGGPLANATQLLRHVRSRRTACCSRRSPIPRTPTWCRRRASSRSTTRRRSTRSARTSRTRRRRCSPGSPAGDAPPGAAADELSIARTCCSSSRSSRTSRATTRCCSRSSTRPRSCRARGRAGRRGARARSRRASWCAISRRW